SDSSAAALSQTLEVTGAKLDSLVSCRDVSVRILVRDCRLIEGVESVVRPQRAPRIVDDAHAALDVLIYERIFLRNGEERLASRLVRVFVSRAGETWSVTKVETVATP